MRSPARCRLRTHCSTVHAPSRATPQPCPLHAETTRRPCTAAASLGRCQPLSPRGAGGQPPSFGVSSTHLFSSEKCPEKHSSFTFFRWREILTIETSSEGNSHRYCTHPKNCSSNPSTSLNIGKDPISVSTYLPFCNNNSFLPRILQRYACTADLGRSRPL